MARWTIDDYADKGMALATYEELEDGSFFGRISPCEGVIAFGATLRDCEQELRSTLEDWVAVGLKLEHPLPAFAGLEDLHDLSIVAQRQDEETISLDEMKRRLQEDDLL